MQLLKTSEPGFAERLRDFAMASATPADVERIVRDLLRDVRERGDTALFEHTRRLDGASLNAETLRVGPAEMKEAARRLPTAVRRAMKKAIHAVEEFHREGIPKGWSGKNLHGARVGEIYYPIRRVGLYIPGGQAPLVSTVVMTAVPARLAKVPEIAAFTPPGRDGKVNAGVLAALHYCGVKEVYRLGGAVAVGAMAYGSQSVRPVDKIFGPGNAYTAEAKRQVVGTVGIDMVAGPSEVMVIADERANPAFVAADLIAQAEHDTRCRVYLVSTDPYLFAAVDKEITRQLPSRERKEVISHVLANGYLGVSVSTLDEAVEAANLVAPEHLELQVDSRHLKSLTKRITTAGAIFCGDFTPTVLGDFAAGPNHTLPTGASGRFSSGLQISDFFRRSSVVEYRRAHLAEAEDIVATFAALEGLDAHGESLALRTR